MEELSHYEGQVKNGRFHGKGKYTDPKGNVIEGTFKNGRLEGEATLSLSNGNVYLVRFQEGKEVEKKLIKGTEARLSPFRVKPVNKPKPKGGGFLL